MTIYRIMGSYRGAPLEPIDETEDPVEAAQMLYEYKLAFGEGWYLTIVRE